MTTLTSSSVQVAEAVSSISSLKLDPMGSDKNVSNGNRSMSTPRHQGGPQRYNVQNASRESTKTSLGTTGKQRVIENAEEMNAYERVVHEINNDKRCTRDIAIGKQIGFYRLREEIGSGNFSQVKLGVHMLTKEQVAVKILDKTKLDAKTQRLLSREISCMERLHHPNVIRLYEVIESLSKLYLIMEYANCGELYTKISSHGRLQEPEAKLIFSQIVAAVDHMHSMGIIHRDLKAENVLFAGSRAVKVADFGFSTPVDGSSGARDRIGSPVPLMTFCGSPPYAAPELFRDDSYYGVFVDIWALGIMLYFIVTGILPFRADTVGKLKKIILDGSYSVPPFVSQCCRSLIASILRLTPLERVRITEIKRSEWLEVQDFPDPVDPFGLGVESMSADERAARKTVANMGISEAMLKSATTRRARSSVTGTYRIVLHNIQKRRFEVDTPRGQGQGDDLNTKNQNLSLSVRSATSSDGKATTNGGKKKSSVCIIV